VQANFVIYWLEHSPAMRNSLGLILSWVIPKTSKMYLLFLLL